MQITQPVQAEGYSMVLVGKRDAGKWEQFFVGSTTKRLIRKFPGSVWIVEAEKMTSCLQLSEKRSDQGSA